MTPSARWPGSPPNGLDSTSTAVRNGAAPRLPYGRHRHDDRDGQAVHMDHDESVVVVQAPAAARLRPLVVEFQTIKRARADGYRRMAEILAQIRDGALWIGQGDTDFDGWCWRTLHINRGTVTRLLAIAAGPIGGTGRAGRPASTTADRGRARKPQEGQVEELPESGNSSTSPSSPVDVSPGAAATARGALGWVARQLGRIERNGVAGWRTELSAAERAGAEREFTRLSQLFACCARAAAAPAAGADGDGEEHPTP